MGRSLEARNIPCFGSGGTSRAQLCYSLVHPTTPPRFIMPCSFSGEPNAPRKNRGSSLSSARLTGVSAPSGCCAWGWPVIIYYISFGQGKLIGHVIECTGTAGCGFRPIRSKYTMFAVESKETPISLGRTGTVDVSPAARGVRRPARAEKRRSSATAHVLNPDQRLQMHARTVPPAEPRGGNPLCDKFHAG